MHRILLLHVLMEPWLSLQEQKLLMSVSGEAREARGEDLVVVRL